MRKSCVLRIDTSIAANTKTSALTSALRHNDHNGAVFSAGF